MNSTKYYLHVIDSMLGNSTTSYYHRSKAIDAYLFARENMNVDEIRLDKHNNQKVKTLFTTRKNVNHKLVSVG